MNKNERPSVRERRKRQDRLFRNALLASLLFHACIFLSWRGVPIPTSPHSAAGPRAGDFYAAGGGMQSVNIRVPPARPIIRPRVPTITLDDIPVEFDFEPQLDLAAMTGEAPGTLEGPPGIEGGQGRGDGGTAAEGFFRLVPPTPRSVYLPPPHEALKGKQVKIWVFVDANGRVVADSTRLNPPTSNRNFNQRLITRAAEWVFTPAMRNGEAVASWFDYEYSIG